MNSRQEFFNLNTTEERRSFLLGFLVNVPILLSISNVTNVKSLFLVTFEQNEILLGIIDKRKKLDLVLFSPNTYQSNDIATSEATIDRLKDIVKKRMVNLKKTLVRGRFEVVLLQYPPSKIEERIAEPEYLYFRVSNDEAALTMIEFIPLNRYEANFDFQKPKPIENHLDNFGFDYVKHSLSQWELYKNVLKLKSSDISVLGFLDGCFLIWDMYDITINIHRNFLSFGIRSVFVGHELTKAENWKMIIEIIDKPHNSIDLSLYIKSVIQ